MKLLESISNMENGIQIDLFLYEMMVIWSAVHELEIEVQHEVKHVKMQTHVSKHITCQK